MSYPAIVKMGQESPYMAWSFSELAIAHKVRLQFSETQSKSAVGSLET